MINHAKESIVVEHAYFSDDKVIEAVRRAAENGNNVIPTIFVKCFAEKCHPA
jgi:hypothetical protein